MGVRGWSNGLPQQIQDRILLTFKLLLQLLWIFFDYPVCESALRFDLASTFTQRKVAAIDRWGGKKHLSMGYILSNCDVYVGGKVRVSEFMIFLDLQHCGSK